jgi:flavin reductase (DIM6/NTAB) family NADH-FMN oxidoreductase RutF
LSVRIEFVESTIIFLFLSPVSLLPDLPDCRFSHVFMVPEQLRVSLILVFVPVLTCFSTYIKKTTMTCCCKQDEDSWLALSEPRQWSRLLYTNPVCFLGTTDAKNQHHVMVVTWLTATNNDGHFVMSLNRRRHTVSVLLENRQDVKACDISHEDCTDASSTQPQQTPPKSPTPSVEFSLSVPVNGMEDLVLAVGGTSGRWGSKFARDGKDHDTNEDQGDDCNNHIEVPKKELNQLGKSSNKRRRQPTTPKYPCGIPGLRAVPLANGTPCGIFHNGRDTESFFIDGSVAHLQCEATSFMERVIDDDHYLVLARVTKAAVKKSHWNTCQNLFQPQRDDVAPYLTFFGSQTFGHVVGIPSMNGHISTLPNFPEAMMVSTPSNLQNQSPAHENDSQDR